MPSVETICTHQWKDPEFRQKWLVGGLLASIPFVNLLFLGYVLRYARRLRRGGDLALPVWEDWGELLLDGLRMLGLKLIHAGLPVALGALVSLVLSSFFALVGLSFLASTIAWLPLTASFFAGWLLWMAGLQRFLRRENWNDLLNWRKTLRVAGKMWPALAVPGLALAGLLALGWPLLGFIIFLGFLPAVAYATGVYLKVTEAVA